MTNLGNGSFYGTPPGVQRRGSKFCHEPERFASLFTDTPLVLWMTTINKQWYPPKIVNFASQFGDIPIIIAGDFQADPATLDAFAAAHA